MTDPIAYHREYKHKKLNEVVLLGSHDAGITKGNSNTKTQDGGIYYQAIRGARFFDVRIAAFFDRSGNATLSSYHDETKAKLPGFATKHTGMTVHTTVLGKEGETLHSILAEAKDFVDYMPHEFLMLKFDKSENWSHIRDACYATLGNRIYKPTTLDNGGANINERTLDELKGRVIVLFDEEGYNNVNQPWAQGILKWKNLNKKSEKTAAGYDEQFPGLQYYGKGGVSRPASGDEAKIQKNFDEQVLLMKGMGAFAQK